MMQAHKHSAVPVFWGSNTRDCVSLIAGQSPGDDSREVGQKRAFTFFTLANMWKQHGEKVSRLFRGPRADLRDLTTMGYDLQDRRAAIDPCRQL